ncbi:hypothetical protein LPJ74_006684 [Coemansia sp. RSA 1843]|nr:hypothetical protein LPJ74_006684 [Coemansia sp. RSA 1843]
MFCYTAIVVAALSAISLVSAEPSPAPAPIANTNNAANVGAPMPLNARDGHAHHAPNVKRCGGCGGWGCGSCGGSGWGGSGWGGSGWGCGRCGLPWGGCSCGFF